MKLKEEVREKIYTNWTLRSKIAIDCNKHEKTVQKWAKPNSEQAEELVSKAVLGVIATYFPEHETILEEE